MMRPQKTALDASFGTTRGFVRLAIANLLWWLGPYRKYGRIDPRRVKRLVFVCQGNICRSPFAQYVAAGAIANIPVASVGLGASEGEAAFEAALETARSFSIDLSAHRALGARSFEFLDGDLCLVMEDRHIRAILPYLEGKDIQVGLLGLWCRPRFALLYDPHRLSEAYFFSCFDRIRRAVLGLGEALGSRSGGSAGQGRANESPDPGAAAGRRAVSLDQAFAATEPRSAKNGRGSEN